jgi:hypothetical protein
VSKRGLLISSLVAFLALQAAPARALSSAQLLVRYEPVAVLHPQEWFPPIAVDGLLRSGQLQQDVAGTWTAVTPTPASLPITDPPGCTSTSAATCWRLHDARCSASTGLASIDCFTGIQAAEQPASAVYGAVLRRGDRIALQYWYWYADDFWSGQFPFTDYVWQAHEGDWEVVTVVLTAAEQPLFAAYSQHSCGKRRAWARVPKTRKTHPLVYVALGTHANYYSAGQQPIDLRPQCYPALGATLLHAYFPAGVFDETGRGRQVRPPLTVVTAAKPQWMHFPGTWGEANFFHGPDPVNTRVAGLAPLGPAFHALWREPVATPLGWPQG